MPTSCTDRCFMTVQLVASEYAKADGLRFFYDTLAKKPEQIQAHLLKYMSSLAALDSPVLVPANDVWMQTILEVYFAVVALLHCRLVTC